MQQVKQAWQVLEWGTPDRAQVQKIGPLKMESGIGSLKDYENMSQAWTYGVERESTKGCKVYLKVYWQKKEEKPLRVHCPVSSGRVGRYTKISMPVYLDFYWEGLPSGLLN